MPPWYALLAPAVPLVLALGFELVIIPSLLAGVLYTLVTTPRPGKMNKRLLRTLYGGLEVAAPPIALFVAVGILLAAVKLPGAVDALEPLVKAVSPQNAVLFVLVFTPLVPLCLHRGPLNVFGLGAGIAGVLIATGIYPAAVVEIIFPCVRGVYDKLSSPLGRYYLYYAPHHAPGGSVWPTATRWPDRSRSTRRTRSSPTSGHRTTPSAMCRHHMCCGTRMPRSSGCTSTARTGTTRLARSADGIHFTYDKAVLSTSMLPAGTTETSYARVFRHDLPSRGARYVMVFMLNNTTNHRDIHWGWSADGRNWSYDQQPLIRHGDVGAVNVGGPHLLHRDNSTFVVYNKGSGGDIMITEVGNDFSKRNHLGVFYNSRSAAPENGRAAAPAFGTAGGVPYMIYEAGERLAGAIAVARG